MAPQHSDLVRLLPLTTRLSIANYPHRNIKMSDHWRMELNNYLQRSHGTRVLKWEHTHIGPQNDLTWTAYAFINGLEYGRGTAKTLGVARELAAEQALRALWASRMG